MCWISIVKNPTKCFFWPSYSDQVLAVLLNTFFFKWPSFVKCWENMVLEHVRGMVLVSAPGSTFTGRGLQPCFVIIWRVVWNDVWPLGAWSVYNWPSWHAVLGSNDIIWLTWCLWGVGVHLLLCGDLLWWSCEGLQLECLDGLLFVCLPLLGDLLCDLINDLLDDLLLDLETDHGIFLSIFCI